MTDPFLSSYAYVTALSPGMWATRQMTKDEDREIYVRTTLRELVVYIIFLVILCIREFLRLSSGCGHSAGFYWFAIILLNALPFSLLLNCKIGWLQRKLPGVIYPEGALWVVIALYIL